MSMPVVAGMSCPRMQDLAVAMLHVMHKGYCGQYAHCSACEAIQVPDRQIEWRICAPGETIEKLAVPEYQRTMP